MVKNIIFDIGNVLVDYKPVEYLSEKGFDGAMIKRILNASVKMCKPNPEIYKMLIEKYNLVAEESIFIDDTAQNVEVARSLGFIGIDFTTKDASDKEIDELSKG